MSTSTWKEVKGRMKLKGKRLYLAGPMSGKPFFNVPEFDVAARFLREEGHDCVSPAELDSFKFRQACLKCKYGTMDEVERECELAGIATETWGDLLARDLKLIANDGIEAIVVLPGWDKSRGATLETYVGRLCGLPILHYPDLKPVAKVELERVHGQATKPFESQFQAALAQEQEQIRREFKSSINSPRYVTREGEIRRVDQKTGGAKGEKQATLGDFAPEALMKVAEVAGFGRVKYARLNYLKGYDWSLSYDALQRHLHAFWGKEDTDPESGLLHLSHAGWHVLCLLAFHLRKLGTDDRP